MLKSLDITEEWRDVMGFESSYQVSSIGRFRSKARIVSQRNRWGDIREVFYKSRNLKLYSDKDGYLKISLAVSKDRVKNFTAHRLVAMAFIFESYFPKAQINHKNFIRHDNRIENLEWVTSMRNMKHSHSRRVEKMRRGENHSSAKLSGTEVLEIRKLAASGTHIEVIAARYRSTSLKNIKHVINRRSWKHL